MWGVVDAYVSRLTAVILVQISQNFSQYEYKAEI